MLTVLAVIPSNTFGGAHNQALRLAPELARGGVQTVVALPVEDGDAADRLSRSGVTTIALALRRPLSRSPLSWLSYLAGLPGQVRRIGRTISTTGADVVQAHGLLQVDVALAARLRGRPLVWQLLDTRPPRWLIALVAPVMLRMSSVVMTTGTTTAEAYPALHGGRRPVIPFYPPASLDAARRSRPDPVVTFGCLANVNPQKGQLLLVRAFLAAGLEDRARLRLRGAVTPGHEALHRTLREAIDGSESERIDLDTAPTTAPEFLPDVDVLVLGSEPRSEGTPTVILEAMGLGLPVIATRVGGVPELVQDQVTGLLVEPGDVEAMADAMRLLATDEPLRTQMGQAGAQLAGERFSTSSTVAAHEHAYSLCTVDRGR